jgi:tRNA/tmRNA/rRNA uracil-C5-methylase (TrmA/RlmC/RlmD family)
LLLACQFPFQRVVGVEWSEELHRVAQQNIRSYRGRRRCMVLRSSVGGPV